MKVLALAVLTCASCSIVPDVRATARYQLLEPSGTFAASDDGSSADSSFESLGLGQEESALSPRADISVGPFDVMVSAFKLDASGSGQTQGAVDLGGVIIPAGENVDSELELTQAVALVTWDLIPTDLVDVGIGVGLTYLDFDLTIDGQLSGRTTTEEQVPVPVLAVRAEVELGSLSANLHVHGIAISYDGVDAMYIDADAYLAYSFADLLGFNAQAALGYRHIALEFEYDDDGSEVDGDLELSGVYFGLSVGL